MFNLDFLQMHLYLFCYINALYSSLWYTKEANIGTTLGALFGGLLLGMILTTVALVIIYRRSKAYVNKRSVIFVWFIQNLLLFFFRDKLQMYLRFMGFLETNSTLNFLIMMHAVLQKLLTAMLSKTCTQKMKR